jgi:hypothetical protein
MLSRAASAVFILVGIARVDLDFLERQMANHGRNVVGTITGFGQTPRRCLSQSMSRAVFWLASLRRSRNHQGHLPTFEVEILP